MSGLKPFALVEHNSDDVFQFEKALREAEILNPIVKIRSNEEAALYLAGQGRFADRSAFPFPSVLFLDLGLPGASGFETLVSLRKAYPRPGVVMVALTGSEDPEIARKAYRLGADLLFVRPARPHDFLNLRSAFPAALQ
jgi:CheY-like chemotaxis protein